MKIMSRKIPRNLTLEMFKRIDYSRNCVGNRRAMGGVSEWECAGIECNYCILGDLEDTPTVMEILEATKKLLEKE